MFSLLLLFFSFILFLNMMICIKFLYRAYFFSFAGLFIYVYSVIVCYSYSIYWNCFCQTYFGRWNGGWRAWGWQCRTTSVTCVLKLMIISKTPNVIKITVLLCWIATSIKKNLHKIMSFALQLRKKNLNKKIWQNSKYNQINFNGHRFWMATVCSDAC